MRKRIVVLTLCFLLLAAAIIPAAAVHSNTAYEETLATSLKQLGLFKGVSDTDFDLNREPSRIEALVMLIRLLGKENTALTGTWSHPFKDVPTWADPYVGYAYKNGLTNGISATQFGNGNANAAMYLTFVLRSLGYSDAGGADFTWDAPFELATSVGILSDSIDTSEFWRADVVAVSHAALLAKTKGSTATLADLLIAAGVFSREDFDSYYTPVYTSSSDLVVAPSPIPSNNVSSNREIVGSANYHGHVYTGGESSTKYHYEALCAGKNSHEITWDIVESRGFKPCGTCVLK